MTRGLGLRGLLLLCAIVCVGTAARAAGTTYAARSYVARWSAAGLEVRSRAGALLCRWPAGALCVPADPDPPVTPSLLRAGALPARGIVDGAPQLTWTWRFPQPGAIAAQVETYRLLPNRIEVRVRVRWRDTPPRLVRMNYGGRLAAGCCDLEGLWRLSHSGAAGDAGQVAPVPGVYTDAGETWYRKRVRLATEAGDLLFVAGGIDDGDVTSWNGDEIGRTPTDLATASWTKVRRYRLGGGGDGDLVVQVHNAAGNGGLWRGPVVIGPAAALDTTRAHDGWTRVEAAGTALYHWCPDSYRQALAGRFTVSLTSRDRTREWVPENVTSGGRFLIPPYVVAIAGAGAWWGLGTLDLPRAEDGLRVEFRDGTLSCPFVLATDPQTPAGGWTEGPRLAILTGESRMGVLRTYLAAVPSVPEPVRQDWWSGPCYCTWGDQVYASKLQPAGDVGALTDEHLRDWLADLRERGLVLPLLTLDAGWWQLSRRVIPDLHAEGRHAIVWTQPHWQPDTTQHSDWAMHDLDGRPLKYDPNNWILDYTSPDVRRHMAEGLVSYVAPDAWGADGIKLDFAYTAAPVWAVHADPSWGAGEQYRARVLRFVYDTMKATRPDALVTGSATNPLFGAVQDVCRLNDDWSADPESFRHRAATALAMGEAVECDDWCAYEHYLRTQAAERPVWGTFTLMSALYRGDRNNAPVPLSAAWATRLRALAKLAAYIPARAGERWTYGPDAGILRRETATGDLVATALPIVGTKLPLQVLVVARDGKLLVCSTAEGEVVLPGIERAASVVAVHHDGTRRPLDLAASRQGGALRVADCAGEVAWYEVELAGR